GLVVRGGRARVARARALLSRRAGRGARGSRHEPRARERGRAAGAACRHGAGFVIAAVVVRSASDQLHTRALATLRALLPHVGVLGPGVYACDLAGTERVLGAPSRIARRIIERLERVNAPASVAVATTPFAARVAAERTADGDVRLVPEPREYLAPLPIEVLPIEPRLMDELGLLGLRSVGDFAALPRGAVSDRFGRGAARAHALARAEDEERVRAAAAHPRAPRVGGRARLARAARLRAPHRARGDRRGARDGWARRAARRGAARARGCRAAAPGARDPAAHARERGPRAIGALGDRGARASRPDRVVRGRGA